MARTKSISAIEAELKKEADESSKVYKKYDKILDKNYKSENWKEYAENRQKEKKKTIKKDIKKF